MGRHLQNNITVAAGATGVVVIGPLDDGEWIDWVHFVGVRVTALLAVSEDFLEIGFASNRVLAADFDTNVELIHPTGGGIRLPGNSGILGIDVFASVYDVVPEGRNYVAVRLTAGGSDIRGTVMVIPGLDPSPVVGLGPESGRQIRRLKKKPTAIGASSPGSFGL